MSHALWPDDTLFIRSDVHSLHNWHLWAAENSCYSFQQRISVNVWAGIIDDYIIGLYVIQDSLTVVHSACFLKFLFYWRMCLGSTVTFQTYDLGVYIQWPGLHVP
jgi:hypothetical protein